MDFICVFVLYLFCIIVPPVNIGEQDARTVHILFHLKTMAVTTFNTYQVWECFLG